MAESRNVHKIRQTIRDTFNDTELNKSILLAVGNLLVNNRIRHYYDETIKADVYAVGNVLKVWRTADKVKKPIFKTKSGVAAFKDDVDTSVFYGGEIESDRQGLGNMGCARLLWRILEEKHRQQSEKEKVSDLPQREASVKDFLNRLNALSAGK